MIIPIETSNAESNKKYGDSDENLPGTYTIQRIFVSVFRGEQLERCAEETHRKFRTRYTFWAYPPQAERFDSAFLLTPASDRYSVRKNRTRSALHVGGE